MWEQGAGQQRISDFASAPSGLCLQQGTMFGVVRHEIHDHFSIVDIRYTGDGVFV